MVQSSRSARVAFVVLTTLSFVTILKAVRISTVQWDFTYLEIGKIIGPIPSLALLVSVLIVILTFSVKTLISFLNSTTRGTKKEILAILKRKSTIRMITLSLALSLAVILSFSLIFMPQVLQAGKKIDLFVAENGNRNLQEYVKNISTFLTDNVQNAYGKPEGSFKIDNEISVTLLDPYLMKGFGVTRADLIVYQGWGTCGQAAILIEELLLEAGYETREAYFKNIDHQWAEVNCDGKWLIVDPWYIGNLVEIRNLKNLKPEFQQASGVEVQYCNGTTVDASHEYGY